MIDEFPCSRHQDAMTNNSYDLVERTQMHFDCGERAQCRCTSRILSCPCIKFSSEAAQVLRFVINNRQHSTQEEQISRP